jgi:hypothetical protein
MLVFDELTHPGKLSQKASAMSDAVGQIKEGRSVVRPPTLPEPEPVRVFPGFDTFVIKTNSVARDPRKDLERMAQRRYQNPNLIKEARSGGCSVGGTNLSTGHAHESASAQSSHPQQWQQRNSFKPG